MRFTVHLLEATAPSLLLDQPTTDRHVSDATARRRTTPMPTSLCQRVRRAAPGREPAGASAAPARGCRDAPGSGVDVRRERADVAQVAVAARRSRGRSRRRTRWGCPSRRTSTSTRPWQRLGLAQQGADLDARPGRGRPGWRSASDSVRPVSMMSSTISTCRPVMSVSRSLRIRTTPRGLGARAVGRDRHPVHLDVPVQRAGQVGHHHHRALEDADQQEVLALVVRLDLGGQLAEPVAGSAPR